jgi:putative peptide zinc metalloprotease protein
VVTAPLFRRDLRISPHRTEAGTSYVVKDPVTFRLGETEILIARQLDGCSTLDVVQQRLDREFGITVSADLLQQFTEQLRRMGLLQSDTEAGGHHCPMRHRVASPLYIRLKAFDPDRFFNSIIGKVWFFFTPGFIVVSLAMFFIALGITIAGWDEFVRDVGRLYRFDALLLAWVTMLLVTTAHEFAHGLTCKHFGGEVHEIGFLLLYFQPAFYCNISDAWLFPEKSKRLWVTFAGAYLETFVWSIATLIWWIAETDTWVSFLATIVMATSGIKSIFNMNPLIKLDGYYLLSDYLEIPNLRQRSMTYLKTLPRRVFRRDEPSTTATRRERRIYVIYGTLAATYSFWLLGLVALRFGSYLVEQYQGPGFIAFSGLLVTVFRNPLSSAARTLPAPLRFRADALARLKRPATRGVLIAFGLALLFLVRMELKVSGEFTVLPVRNADVHAAVEGTIEQLYVEEGDRVRAGDVLLRLSERDYRAALGKVDADIAEKRATLKMLRAGPRPEEIGLTRGDVATARTRSEHAGRRFDEAKRMHDTRMAKAHAVAKAAEGRLQYARSDLQRRQELFQKGLIARKELEDAEQEVTLREQELEAAEAERRLVSADTLAEAQQEVAVTQRQVQEADSKLKLLLAGSRPETIEATEAAIARLETERRYLSDQLRLTAIMSPVTGIVTTPRLKEKIGEHVNKGDLILKVFEMQTVTPEVTVSEKEIAEVSPGQTVVLKARAYPGRSFTGRVKAIAPAAIEESGLGRKIFRVTIAMDGASDLLKPEMTGNAKIFCGRRSVAELLTRRLARYVRVEFWSWW